MGTHEQRWDWDAFNDIQGVPWEPVPGRGLGPIRSSVEIPGDRAIPMDVPGEPPAIQSRAETIFKEDVLKHGPTVGYEGCTFMTNARYKITGEMDYRPRSDKCRERFENIWASWDDKRFDRWSRRIVQENNIPMLRDEDLAEQGDRSKRALAGQSEEDNKRSNRPRVAAESDNEFPNEPGIASGHVEPPPSTHVNHKGDANPPLSGGADHEGDGDMGCLMEVSDQFGNLCGNAKDWVGDNSKGNRHHQWDDYAKRDLAHAADCGRDVKFHVTEVYSPERVNEVVKQWGLIPGMSLDLTTNDPDDNKSWDFNDMGKANKARDIVENKRAVLLIGSPLYPAFSSWQHLDFSKMIPAQIREKVEYGVRHLEFALKLCEIQRKSRLYFLHEHPAYATSWMHVGLKEMSERSDV